MSTAPGDLPSGELFRDFTDKQREDLADKGHAMPDGSFPIQNAKDLMNARQAVGRAKDPEAAKAHIRKRAKELGIELPEDFGAEDDVDAERFYSDDQARDDNGRWSGGGNTDAGKRAEGARTYTDHREAKAYHEAAAAKLAGKAGYADAAAMHKEAAEAHQAASMGKSSLDTLHARNTSNEAHHETRLADRKAAEAKSHAADQKTGHVASAAEHRTAQAEHEAKSKAADAAGKITERDLHGGAAYNHGLAADLHERAARTGTATAHAKANAQSETARRGSAAIAAFEKHMKDTSLKREQHAAADEAAYAFASQTVAFAAALDVGDDAPTRTVDGVEYVVGKPVHIFPAGKWTAVDGRRVEFTADDAEAMLSDLKTRHTDVALTFDHETDKARGSEAGGWMPVAKFEFKDDGLWNTEPLWRKDVYESLLKTGAFRYLSGDALGVGSAREGDAFHPRRLLAASLVPKPGFVRGLRGIEMSADDKKETTTMTRTEFCQTMGLKASATKAEMKAAFSKLEANATTEELRKAFDKFMDEEGAEHEHEMGAAPKHSKEDCAVPGCKQHEEEMGSKKKHDEAADDEAAEDETDEEEEEQMGAEKPKGPTDAEVSEKFAALGKQVAEDAMKKADEAIKTAKEAAVKTVEETFAAQKKAEEIDKEILAAQKDGRLTTEKVEMARKAFGVSLEFGREVLGALPKPSVAPGEAVLPKNGAILGTGAGVKTREDLRALMTSEDPSRYREQGKFLTAVARFSANTGCRLDAAVSAVLAGENEKLEKELFAAGQRTAEDHASEHIGQFRASQRQIPIDPEYVEFIKKRVRSGAIPEALIPADVQQFASISDFQPSARTTLPMALGFVQAEFVGDEAFPVFVGGADEKAAWPEFGFEKFASVAAAAGILGAPTRTSLNVTWHTVTLDKYPVQMDIDRRVRAASVTLPRGIDTIALENLKSQVGVTKEVAQYTALTTTGNYADSSYYPTLGTPWSTAGQPSAYAGVPITDITAGMQHVRVAVRAWPDLLLLSPAAATAMRKNQQIIDCVRYTGTKADPGTMLTNAQIAAIFAGLFNLAIAVGEAGSSSLPSGAAVSDVWGLDAWLVCTGKGAIEAPRFGMTVAAAGSPRVRAFPNELLGADGSDSLVYTDAWSIVPVNNKAAYWFKNAAAAI